MPARSSIASSRRRVLSAGTPVEGAASALGRALHQAGLLAALVLAPTVWGRFDFIGGSIVLFCLCLSAAGILLMRPTHLIPRSFRLFSFRWAVGALLLISLISLLFSVSKHASILDILRLIAGVLLFWLALWWEELRVETREFGVQSSEAGAGNSEVGAGSSARAVGGSEAGSKRRRIARGAVQAESPQRPSRLTVGIFLPLVVIAAAVYDWRFYLDSDQLRALLGLVLLAVFWLVLLLRSTPEVVGPLHGALAGAAVAGGYGVFGWLHSYFVLKNTTLPAFGTFFNPNPFAGFLGMALLLALAACWPAPERSRRPRVAAVITALLVLASLPFTDSKGAYVAIYVALAVFFVLASLTAAGSRTKRAILSTAVIIVMFGLPLGAILGSNTLRARVAPAFSLQNQSNMFRYLTWKGTLQMARARPVTGFGPGAFEQGFARYAIAGYTRRAHQNYLETAAELGIPGLAAMLWLLGSAVIGSGVAARRASTVPARLLAAGALGAIIVMAIHSLFDYDWFIGASFVYFMLACALGLSQNRRTPAVPSPDPADRQWVRWAVGVGLAAIVIESALLGWADREYRVATTSDDPWGAKERLDRVVSLAPTFAAAIWRRAALEPGPDGERMLKRAIALEPTSYSYWFTLGRRRDARGDLTGAREAFTETLKRYPQHLGALLALAEVELRLARPAKAREAYMRVAAIQEGPVGRYPAVDYQVNTEYAEAHYALGVGIANAVFPGTEAAAMEHFRKALAVLDDYDRRGRGLDEQRRAIGEFDPAKEQRLATLRATTYARLSKLVGTRGDETEAGRYHSLAEQLQPDVASMVLQEDTQWRR